MNEPADERLAELRTIAEETRVRRIAPFDPPTVLALLSDVKRLREERDDMRRRLDAVEALARNGIGKPCNRTLDRIILAARGPRE